MLPSIKRRQASMAALKAARKHMPANPAEHLSPGLIDSLYSNHIHHFVARGKIAEHVDGDFPPWSYILVVQCQDAVFVQRGCPPIALATGDIIEFRNDQRHRLEQHKDHHLLWMAIDSDERVDLRKLSSMFINMTRQ